MKTLGFGKKITSLVLCVSMAGALFTGCKKGDDLFPSIEAPNIETESEESTENTDDQFVGGDIRELKVALPYSDLTIQCLAAMLYCKNNGLWDSTDDGSTIDTAFLSSVATNYVVTNIGCGSTGATLDVVKDWSKTGMPDLYLAQDSNAVWQAGYAGRGEDGGHRILLCSDLWYCHYGSGIEFSTWFCGNARGKN